MRVRFIACDGCARHVRAGDGACPFCGAAAPAAPPVERTFARGLSRAAMFAAGTAGVVVAMVDCGSGNVTSTAFYGVGVTNDSGATADAADEDGNVGGGIFYGVACPLCEAGADTSAAADAGRPDAQDAAGVDAASEGGTDGGSGD